MSRVQRPTSMGQVRSRKSRTRSPSLLCQGGGDASKSGVSRDGWREVFIQRFGAGTADRRGCRVGKQVSCPFLLGVVGRTI